jgi:hypothetical protein
MNVDTGDNLFTSVNDTGNKFIAGINLSPVTTMPVIRVCGVSIDASFRGGLNETIDCCVRLRRPEISPDLFEQFWWPQGPRIRVCQVSMDASFSGGSNEIGSCVRLQMQEIMPFWFWRSQGPQGPLIRVPHFKVVPMINDTIDGRVRAPVAGDIAGFLRQNPCSCHTFHSYA